MKNIDEIYKDWSGKHHTTNSNLKVHNSSECQDFAQYYHTEMTFEKNKKLSFFKNSEEKNNYKKTMREIYKDYPKNDNLCEIKELQLEIEKNIKQIEKMKIKQSAIRSCT